MVTSTLLFVLCSYVSFSCSDASTSPSIAVHFALFHSVVPCFCIYSTDCSKAVVPVFFLLFVALWFILRGDLFLQFCLVFCSCVSVLLALQLPRLGKRELILVLFVSLFDLRLFGFVRFFLLVSGKGCGL